MKFKYLYAIGDSFTYGDNLLAYEKNEQPTNHLFFGVPPSLLNSSSLIMHEHTHPELVKIQRSLTFIGKIAAHYGITAVNYARSGASIDGIALQCRSILYDIRLKKINPADCLVLIGLTSVARKLFLNLNTATADSKALANAAGSMLISHPEHTARGSAELTKAYALEYTQDQLIIDFAMALTNIANFMNTVGLQFRFLNIWNTNWMQTPCTQTQEIVNAELEIANTMQYMWPQYPNSMASELYHVAKSMIVPNGHPSKHVHSLYAKYIIDKINNELSFN